MECSPFDQDRDDLHVTAPGTSHSARPREHASGAAINAIDRPTPPSSAFSQLAYVIMAADIDNCGGRAASSAVKCQEHSRSWSLSHDNGSAVHIHSTETGRSPHE